MDSIMRPVSRVMNAIFKLLQRYSQIVLLIIVLVVSAQVTLRQLGKVFPAVKSLPWSEEVSLFLMVWMAFLALAIGVEGDLHISISMFYQKFPKPLQVFFKYLNLLLTLAVGIFFLYYGVQLVISTMGSTLPATKWPKGTMYSMIPVSGFFVIYFSLLRLLGLERYLPHNMNKQEDA